MKMADEGRVFATEELTNATPVFCGAGTDAVRC